MGGRKRLGAPELGLARHVPDRAKDVEGDPPRRDPPPTGVQRPDPKRQVIKQQRALSRPKAGANRLEDHRREHLDPVGHQLAMI